NLVENILLIINIILAAILVVLVLFQKSEGGALGIGVSQDNFMLSRSAGNFLTKATAIIATLFIICSLCLTILSRGELTPTTSVLDKIEETDDAPKVPDSNN
ncbi:preprotein translocase subunit SecG, partial [Candidatus Pelagibacter sp.]|nr:preprotein translocase subunit SecG [Candidatus Pelagibacter sp.]